MAIRRRPPLHCRICGSADVHTDEVRCIDVLELRECARCGDRSTRRLTPALRAAPAPHRAPEVASAA